MNQATKHRLFLALFPPEDVKSKIIEYRDKLVINKNVTKIVTKDKLHITLFFLGDVDLKYLPEIKNNIKQIKFQNFNLKLDHTGYFSHSRTFWLGCNNIPEKLLFLVKNIYKSLQNISDLPIDYSINLKSIYIPHVTLYKHVALGDVTIPANHNLSINWDVNDFCLVRSTRVDNLVEYEQMDCFRN